VSQRAENGRIGGAMAQYDLPIFDDEQRLVESGRSRDPSALDLLYRAYAPALRALCHSRLGDPNSAEDAAHEVILKAHAAMDRFRPDARLWPWLATIAMRVCSDMRRAGRRLAPLAPDADQPGPEPDDEAERRVRAGLVVDAMHDLPERYRLHLYRRDYEGRTYEEMAAMHGTSVASVRSVLFRARRALGDKVTELARDRGHWPLPAFVPLIWGRLRDRVGTWRPEVAQELGSRAGPLLPLGGAAVPLAAAALVATLGFVAPPAPGPGPTPPAQSASAPGRADAGVGAAGAGPEALVAGPEAVVAAESGEVPDTANVVPDGGGALPVEPVTAPAGPAAGRRVTAPLRTPPTDGPAVDPPSDIGSVPLLAAAPPEVAAPSLPDPTGQAPPLAAPAVTTPAPAFTDALPPVPDEVPAGTVTDALPADV
jgi:RNA polymerase sigma-70 factor (ECF subfamily)